MSTDNNTNDNTNDNTNPGEPTAPIVKFIKPVLDTSPGPNTTPGIVTGIEYTDSLGKKRTKKETLVAYSNSTIQKLKSGGN